MCYVIAMASRTKKKDIKIVVSDSDPLECDIGGCDWFDPEIGYYCSLYDSDLDYNIRDLAALTSSVSRCAECIKEFGGVKQ